MFSGDWLAWMATLTTDDMRRLSLIPRGKTSYVSPQAFVLILDGTAPGGFHDRMEIAAVLNNHHARARERTAA